MAGLAVYLVVEVVQNGCLTASVPDYPPVVDCGDHRRGAFVFGVAATIVAFPVAGVLALPYLLIGRGELRRAAAEGSNVGGR